MTTEFTTSEGPVLIIGGGGGMGAWLVENFWSAAGEEVVVADVTEPSGSNHYAWHTLDFSGGRVSGLPDLSAFRTIVVATPIAQTGLIASRVLTQITTPTLVIDVASAKQGVVETIERALPEQAEYVSVHPLFGPQIASPVGQTFVVCPTARSSELSVAAVEAMVRAAAATPSRMSPQEHDSAMALVQGLTHFVALSTASAIADSGVDFRHALQLLTPPFRALAGLIGRVVDIPPAPPNGSGARIYADIQTVGYADTQKIRDAFIKSATELDALAREGHRDDLASKIESVAEQFHPEMLRTSRNFFAQSHASAHAEATALHNLQTSGAQCAVRKQTGDEVIVGRIVDFTPGAIALEVHSCVSHDADGASRYGIACDDRSRRSAAKLGFSIPADRIEWLSRSDHSLISPLELDAWKCASLRHHARDLTVLVPAVLDAAPICALVPRMADGVISCAIHSRYSAQREEGERITLRLALQGDRDPAECLQAIEAALGAFGIAAPCGSSVCPEPDAVKLRAA